MTRNTCGVTHVSTACALNESCHKIQIGRELRYNVNNTQARRVANASIFSVLNSVDSVRISRKRRYLPKIVETIHQITYLVSIYVHHNRLVNT